MAQLTVNSTLTSLEDTLSILAILECGSYNTIDRYMSQFNACARQVSPNKFQVSPVPTSLHWGTVCAMIN